MNKTLLTFGACVISSSTAGLLPVSLILRSASREREEKLPEPTDESPVPAPATPIFRTPSLGEVNSQLHRLLWEHSRINRGGEWKRFMDEAATAYGDRLQMEPSTMGEREAIMGHYCPFLKPPKSQVIVFLSSTFDDIVSERDVLWGDVFPFLRELCHSMGLTFGFVDMRWVTFPLFIPPFLNTLSFSQKGRRRGGWQGGILAVLKYFQLIFTAPNNGPLHGSARPLS